MDGLGGAPETLHMLAAFEDFTLIDPDALEDTVAVEQAVVVHTDGGLVFRNHATVDVDDGQLFFGRSVCEGVEGCVRPEVAAGGGARRCFCCGPDRIFSERFGRGFAVDFDKRLLNHFQSRFGGGLG